MPTTRYSLSPTKWTLIGAGACFVQLTGISSAFVTVAAADPPSLDVDGHVLSFANLRDATFGVPGQNVYARAFYADPTGVTVSPCPAPADDGPAEHVFDITPGPGDLPYTTRALRCATGGTLTATLLDGTSTTLRFTDGETRAVRVRKVTAATGAAGIEGIA